MEWAIEYLFERKVLVVRARGVLDAVTSERLIAAGAAAAAQHGCTRHLVDCRHATISLSVLDLYDRPDLCQAHGIPHNARIAMVFSRFSEDIRLLEATAVNQGINVRTFTNEDQAMSWLCGASSQLQ